jgi:hypothetical protein
MMNLIEIMQAAQGGNAYTNLAQNFKIAPEQAQKAVEAVLPAFSIGLQHQTQSLEGWQNLLASLGQAQNSARFFDSDGDGIPDHLDTDGNNALGAMFGAPKVAEAVAAQAAQFAGLPANVMQQMLPVIATMILGGLFKGASGNGLGGLLGTMFGQNAAPQPQAGGMLGSILGAALGNARPAAPPVSGLNAGLGDLLGAMLGGSAKPAAPPPPADPVSAGLDALKGMFETGKQVQTNQIDAFSAILQQFTQGRK